MNKYKNIFLKACFYKHSMFTLEIITEIHLVPKQYVNLGCLLIMKNSPLLLRFAKECKPVSSKFILHLCISCMPLVNFAASFPNLALLSTNNFYFWQKMFGIIVCHYYFSLLQVILNFFNYCRLICYQLII